MKDKIWGGRFKGKINPAFDYFSSSLSEDYKLASCDIRSSKVHCRMLQRMGLLSRTESRRILSALDAIYKSLDSYEKDFSSRRFEDIHSFIEKELIRRVGVGAKKINTARSRNDQVNQSTRMYCKESVERFVVLIGEVQLAIVNQAERHKHLVIAGLTHLKKAQPILFSHQLLSYVESLERSKDQLRDALKRIDILTLGSGALAGTSIRIDREWVRKQLNFSGISTNSLDAVGSRDFLAEFLFILAHLGVQLSRVAEDFLIGQMDEIGWYEIPEELCTGSSMMPQKKNPDFLELARGAASALIGNSHSLLILLKGLPSSYNRDLQWDKRPLFHSVELTTQLLTLFRIFFKGLKINKDRVQASLADDSLCATDLAEYLVQQGLPFRDAHERVGRFVGFCEDHDIPLKGASLQAVKKYLGGPIRNLLGLLDPKSSVSRKKSTGSTNPVEVNRQLKKWRRKLSHESL